LLVHPSTEGAPGQQRSKAAAALLQAREEMLGAHGKAVEAAEATRTGRKQTLAEAENEWEKERERAPEPRATPAMQRVEEHQCPPFRERMVPIGTSVRVVGSARRGDGRQRRRIDSAKEEGEEDGGGSVWHGEVVGISRATEDYLVASCETRTWEDGFDPFTAPHGTIRVAWTNITIVGGPALSSEGAARWQDYERLRAEETALRGGGAETWLEERRRCATAERQRVALGRARMAQREEAAKAQQAAAEERTARFAAEHERLRNEPGPRGAGPRTAHPGGIVTTNKAHATAKFLERKGKDAGDGCAKGEKRVRGKDEEEEEEGEAKRARAALAPTARREPEPVAAAKTPVPATTAQRREGVSSSEVGAAAGSGTTKAAAALATTKRQREEDEQTGQAATAAAKIHSDTGQTGAATDGDGGAARAAEGAEPAAKKKKRRQKKKSHDQRSKARRDRAAAAQGDRSQTNT